MVEALTDRWVNLPWSSVENCGADLRYRHESEPFPANMGGTADDMLVPCRNAGDLFDSTENSAFRVNGLYHRSLQIRNEIWNKCPMSGRKRGMYGKRKEIS